MRHKKEDARFVGWASSAAPHQHGNLSSAGPKSERVRARSSWMQLVYLLNECEFDLYDRIMIGCMGHVFSQLLDAAFAIPWMILV